MKKRAWICDHCKDTLKKVGFSIEVIEESNAVDVCAVCKRRTVVNFMEAVKRKDGEL